jgi:hypothetical protein
METLKSTISNLVRRFIANDPWVVIPVMFVIFAGLFISIYLSYK